MPVQVKVYEPDGNPLFKGCLNVPGNAPKCGPCGQCQAYKLKDKRRCKLKHCKTFKYCWIHLAKPFYERKPNGKFVKRHIGVRLQTSTIPNAGLGLFATRKFKRNEQIAEYGGKEMTRKRLDELYPGDLTAPYGLAVSKTKVKNADLVRGPGSYANAPYKTKRKPNARLGNKYLRANKTIQPGEEILVSYGQSYFRGEQTRVKQSRVKVDSNARGEVGKYVV